AVRVQTLAVAGQPPRIVLHLSKEMRRQSEQIEVLRERYSISGADVQLVKQVLQGRSNREIAAALNFTVGTVKVYLHYLFEKMNVHSRAELLAVIDRIGRGN